MNKVDYYNICIKDYYYLKSTLNLPLYNNITVGIQQVTEKALKSIVEFGCINAEKELTSHNLRTIAKKIKDDVGISFDEKDMAYLKDFYYDARYPGDDYIEVSRDQCEKCLDIMNNTLLQINNFRQSVGLSTFKFEELHLTEPELSLFSEDFFEDENELE